MIAPLSVVPHPKNRGGDPVKSLRTMQLNGTITVDGYDSVEANSNAVAVEERRFGRCVFHWQRWGRRVPRLAKDRQPEAEGARHSVAAHKKK